LATATIDGVTAFVNPSQLPVYTHGNDSVNTSTCTGVPSAAPTSGCLHAWPAVEAPAGALPSPWTSFTRPDTGTLQLEYKGQPLYTFIHDTADVSAGNGIAAGGGTFSLATP
jgi:predicted lipoprotein with Yx(FWY)xxD motif